MESVLYTGKQRDEIKTSTFEIQVPPNCAETIELEVTFDDYFKRLLDQVNTDKLLYTFPDPFLDFISEYLSH